MYNSSPKPQNPKIAKLKRWLNKHRLTIALLLGATIVTGVFLYALSIIDTSHPSPIYTHQQKPPEKFYSPMTGLEVSSREATELATTGVMIENSPESRPQSGLKDAGVVYEAVAEGGITRFMVLYQQEKPELIGPVRSLRIYYLDWAAPYQASIAHVGGSYNALEAVRSGYRDIDQFFNAGAYWRAADRYAPHNVYTSGSNLDELNAAKGYNKSSFTSFDRVDEKPAEEPSATAIQVGFSSPLYASSYTYSPETNSYARFLAGEPHNDREKGQITPKVVVVLKVGAQSRGGSDGYEDLLTSGSGQAYVFQNGTATEVTWQKADRDSKLTLIDSAGEPVKLVRGQTWVSAITDRGSVSWQ